MIGSLIGNMFALGRITLLPVSRRIQVRANLKKNVLSAFTSHFV